MILAVVVVLMAWLFLPVWAGYAIAFLSVWGLVAVLADDMTRGTRR
jgi:hypothetical protein